MLQFKRAANIYFLLISVLTCLSFSPKSPTSMIGTFAVVRVFTMFKELYEDIQRYRSDKEVNNRKCTVVKGDRQESKRWGDIRVGDGVKVGKDEEIPADMVFLGGGKDIVYVDTMNLDGETNLKEKYIVLNAPSSGTINCDLPNENLDHFEATLHCPVVSVPVSLKNFLLRGCYLRNTDYCHGVVVYVGGDTKIMRNAKKAPKKVSKIMQRMNHMLYTVFCFQFALILAYASLSLLWNKYNSSAYLNLTAGECDMGAQPAHVLGGIFASDPHLAVRDHRNAQTGPGLPHIEGCGNVRRRQVRHVQELRLGRGTRPDRLRVQRQDRHTHAEQDGVPQVQCGRQGLPGGH